MRGALIHGVLLAVMLVYGYRTWTRDKSDAPTTGSVVLWDKTENDLVSIEYKATKKITKIEKKADYWWGSDTTIDMKPKPPKPGEGSGSASTGSGAGSAGSAGSGSAGSAAAKPPVEEEEVGRKTHEFPLGDGGDKMIKDWTAARALRDLGPPNDDAKKDYKLVDAKTTLTITFKDGPKTFLVGGSVYGGSDRYVQDQKSGHAYVLSKDLVSGLEIGESSLHLVDPRGFEAAKIDQVTVEANGKSKTEIRSEQEQDGQKRKTWADAETKTPNTLAANFIDGINNLRPTEYNTTAKASDMQVVLKLTYKSDKGAVLGTLQLLRYEKPGQLQEGQELDPANPPKGDTEYYILTEKTRVPGLVRKDTAQRTENDIDALFSGKTEPTNAGSGKSLDPHGNPLGPIPGHGMGSAAPGLHPGSSPTPPVPGAGSAAKAPAPPAPPALGSGAAPAPSRAQVPGTGSAGPAKAPAPATGSAAAPAKAPTPPPAAPPATGSAAH